MQPHGGPNPVLHQNNWPLGFPFRSFPPPLGAEIQKPRPLPRLPSRDAPGIQRNSRSAFTRRFLPCAAWPRGGGALPGLGLTHRHVTPPYTTMPPHTSRQITRGQCFITNLTLVEAAPMSAVTKSAREEVMREGQRAACGLVPAAPPLAETPPRCRYIRRRLLDD